VAHITRVDTVNSLLGKEPNTTLADYFQGFSQFNKRGLPCKLLAEKVIKLKATPSLLEINKEINYAKANRDAKKTRNLK
jgi:hypothetical protein